jgi:hypothetical protein
MNSKNALVFATACIASAALSPAKSYASATQKGTAWAQVNVPELAVEAPRRQAPYNGVPYTNHGAGYFAYPTTGDVGSVSVTFTVPSIKCKSSSDQEWLLPGIWVYDTSNNLTQQVDLNLLCENGTIHMFDVICIAGGGCAKPSTINPGDLIVATLSETATGTFGQIRDITTGHSDSESGAAAPTDDETVFVGVEGPALFEGGAVTKVPTFAKAAFTKVQLNGYYFSDWHPLRYNLASTGSTVQINTTALQDNGDQFVDTFVHN